MITREQPRTLAGATSVVAEAEAAAVEHLEPEECWGLIRAHSFGRLAVEGLDGMPNVFPVNHIVHDQSIYIRSAPGSKLLAIAAHPFAAFEIDGEDEGFLWSVVLRGAARRLSTDSEIHESGVYDLATSSPTGKYNYICLTPSTVSGRRFAVRPAANAETGHQAILRAPVNAHEPTRPYEDTWEWPDTDQPRSERPQAIAHVPPREPTT